MEAERGRKRGPADPPEASPDPERAYARRIDCGASSENAPAPPPPPESGRGTGRLRNPREEH